jgi:DUF2407 C-terminal domain/DUF2407 ubiquitin-like domain
MTLPSSTLVEGVELDSIQVIVRFAHAHPDTSINIAEPNLVPIAALRSLIRVHLPLNQARCRLRLIHLGRLLRDSDAVSSCLGRSRGPLQEDSASANDDKSNSRTYIHCSIGDALTEDELQKEKEEEEAFSRKLQKKRVQTHSTFEASGLASKVSAFEEPTVYVQPQGFERLLAQGFTQDDLAALRASFLSVLAQSRTASQMPTGDELRLLEDRWLDSTAFESYSDEDHYFDDGGGIAGADQRILGFVIGFFWPAVAIWAFCEPEMWSEAHRNGITLGVLCNMVLGCLRYISLKVPGT